MMPQLIIISVYFLVIIGIGVWSKRRAGSQNGFFVAHRRGTLLLITGSLVATAIGGSATVGMAGLGFKQGLTGAWWLLVGSVGLVILGFFFARKVRHTALYTLPELVERQYDRRMSLAASILIVIAWVGVVAGQIVAAGTVISILGIGSAAFWMTVFTIICVTYAILGGQFSIIRTDFFQAVLLFFGIFISLALVFPQVGGLNGLRTSLPPNYFSFPTSPEFDWKMLLSLLILVGATYVVGPDMYSRLFCAKEERTAQRSAFLSAFLFIPLAFAVVFIGMFAKVLYPEIPGEGAFPQVITRMLSPGLSGLILAALIAALMSSADTCLLTQSALINATMSARKPAPRGRNSQADIPSSSVCLISRYIGYQPGMQYGRYQVALTISLPRATVCAYSTGEVRRGDILLPFNIPHGSPDRVAARAETVRSLHGHRLEKRLERADHLRRGRGRFR